MEFLTTKEMAKTLNLTDQTIRKYIKNEQINASKVNGRFYILPSELERFMKQEQEQKQNGIK